MAYIKKLIFGERRQPVDTISTGFKTTKPIHQPTYDEWCKEFRVGMLYDRKIIHL